MPLLFILGAGAVALIAFLTFYNLGKKPAPAPVPQAVTEPVKPAPAPAVDIVTPSAKPLEPQK